MPLEKWRLCERAGEMEIWKGTMEMTGLATPCGNNENVPLNLLPLSALAFLPTGGFLGQLSAEVTHCRLGSISSKGSAVPRSSPDDQSPSCMDTAGVLTRHPSY